MSIQFPEELLRALRNSNHIAVLTGAGISAESGIPTFREAQTGLWARFAPEELATPSAFRRDPVLVWKWYEWRRQLVLQKEPNAGHNALVELQRRVAQLTLITQNVDGLHQEAGSRDVIELHGRLGRYKCFERGHQAENVAPQAERPPQCTQCESLLRPDVVWFGESLPFEAIEKAAEAAGRCDVFFSIGTSSIVYPAAQLPQIAVSRGALFVEINPNATPLTEFADYSFQLAAGRVLPALVEAL